MCQNATLLSVLYSVMTYCTTHLPEACIQNENIADNFCSTVTSVMLMVYLERTKVRHIL